MCVTGSNCTLRHAYKLEQLAAKTSIFSLFFQGLSPSMDLLFEDEYRGAEDRAEGISVSYSSEVR